jgi:hypothetical protein
LESQERETIDLLHVHLRIEPFKDFWKRLICQCRTETSPEILEKIVEKTAFSPLFSDKKLTCASSNANAVFLDWAPE